MSSIPMHSSHADASALGNGGDQGPGNQIMTTLPRRGTVSPESSDSSFDHGSPSSVSSSDLSRATQRPSRKEIPTTQPPTSFSKTFQFISKADPDPRKTVRKHVMKEFQRKRRLQRDQSGIVDPMKRTRSKGKRKTKSTQATQATQLIDPDVKISILPDSNPSPAHKISDKLNSADISVEAKSLSTSETLASTQERPSEIGPRASPNSTDDVNHQYSKNPRASSESTEPSSEVDQSILSSSAMTSTSSEQGYINNPKTLLGAGRVDPFESLPIKGGFTTHALVDHYVCTLSYLVFRMVTRIDFNPIKETFRLAIRDPVSFHAILTYASSHVACLHGVENTRQVIEHKGKTLQLLTKKLDPSRMDNSDSTILAVQQLTSIEERWGRKDVAKTHWIGLSRLVESRGGLFAIRKATPRLEILINFTDLATRANQPGDLQSTPVAILSSLPEGTVEDDTSSFYDTSNLYNVHDNPKYHQQFRRFIANITVLSMECLSYYRAGIPHALNIPRRLLMLRPGTVLHDLLIARHQERRGIPFNEIQEFVQMGVLIYLAMTFWDYRHDSRMVDYFLKAQAANIAEWSLETQPSIETLLFVFARGEPGTDLERPERMWFTGRMVGALKTVGNDDWLQIKRILFSFVAVNCGGGK